MKWKSGGKKRWFAVGMIAGILFLFSGLQLSYAGSPPAGNDGWEEGKTETSKTWYKLVTAVIFIWGQEKADDKVWSPAKPGKEIFYEKDTSYTFDHVGDGRVTRAEIYPYAPGKPDLDDPNLAVFGFSNNAGEYNRNFYLHGSEKIEISNVSMGIDEISYRWKAELSANDSLLDVTDMMKTDTGLALIREELMGGYVPDSMQAYLSSAKQLGDQVRAYLLFVPYVIEYDVTTIEETPEESQEVPDSSPEIFMTGQAVLSVAQQAYKGHAITAYDDSFLEYDGVRYGAAFAYEKGLGKGSLRLLEGGDGTAEAITAAKYKLRYESTGEKTVELRLRMKNGDVLTDKKSIHILDTPHVDAFLSGTQKQNRRQDLNIAVAQDPASPIKKITVQLLHPKTRESVTLYYHPGSEEKNALNNSTHIKTRPIQPQPSDEEWICCGLPFLTKFEQQETLQWSVTAEDAQGKQARAEGEFTVMPDKVPRAEIGMDPVFYRNEGENIAQITVQDISQTDGDQLERTWRISFDQGKSFLPLEQISGSADLSFGSGKMVSFPKEGVGEALVTLLVKDVWTEETLEEYISPQDYLEAQTSATALVDNIAPFVSVTALRAKKAEFILPVRSAEQEKQADKIEEEIIKRCRQRGIDADVFIERSGRKESANGLEALFRVNTPSGYQVNWTSYEKENFIVDDRALYKIDATWEEGKTDAYPQSPYRITAWNALEEDAQEVGSVLWTFPFGAELVDATGTGSGTFYFGQDDRGMYLFFICRGNTLVLTKDTGTLLTVLPYEMGRENYVFDQKIYTMTENGIYKVSIETGQRMLLREYPVNGKTKRFGGTIRFLEQDGSTAYLCSLDPDRDTVTRTRLSQTENDSGNSRYECLGIDQEGSFSVAQRADGRLLSVGIYTNQGNLRKKIGLNPSNDCQAAAIPDETGRYTYLAWAFTSSSKTSSGKRNYDTHVYLQGIDTEYTQSIRERSRSDYPSTDRIIYGLDLNGRVYVNTAAEYLYVWQRGTGVYEQRARSYQFLPSEGKTEISETFGLWTGFGNHAEYTFSGDALFAVHSSVGDPSCHNVKGSDTMVVRKTKTEQVQLDHYRNKYFGKDRERDIQHILDISRWEEELSDCLENLTETTGALRAETQTSGPGILKTQIELEPGVTYYYEYETKGNEADSIGFSHQISVREEEPFEKDLYEVTHCYREDFNDSRFHTYFSFPKERVLDGAYRGAYSKGYGSSNKLYSDQSELSFTVEKGKKAIVSFDYRIQYDETSYELANYVSVDGSPWLLYTGLDYDKTKHYTHPVLLEEGRHTLKVYAGGYGSKNSSSATYLDNLKVEYVQQKNGEKEEAHAQTETHSVSALNDGWYTVKGSFSAPFSVQAYQSHQGELFQAHPSNLPFARLDTSATNRTDLYLEIPQGKTAAYLSVGTSTSVRGDYSVQYRWEGKEVSWRCYGDTSEHPFGIPRRYTIVMPQEGVEGTQKFRASYSKRRGTAGNFTEIQVFLTDHMAKALGERKFFVSREEKALYAENRLYKGKSELSFLLPEGKTVWYRNLKIYKLEDGVKQYVTLPSMDDPSQITAWEKEGVRIFRETAEAGKEKEDIPVFQKGELVQYEIFYYDYEGDPSKKSYWIYTHQPLQDGLHPQSGMLLHQPIERFEIDGKYTVRHWQQDDTTRGKQPQGDPLYDKSSNTAELTFYIEGAALEGTPWIRSVSTSPAAVREGMPYELWIQVDDREKDLLSLETELYYEGEQIAFFRNENLKASQQGIYPTVYLTDLPVPRAGIYTVVCRVSDESRSSVKRETFSVTSAYRSLGMVSHTPLWDSNRKRYNLNRFGREYNEICTFEEYKEKDHPRERGINVFWSGEAFLLQADTDPKTESLAVWIQGWPAYRKELKKTEGGQDGLQRWQGVLWDASMIDLWGRNAPQELVFIFEAKTGGKTERLPEVSVIVDSKDNYWQVHRLF